MNDFWYLWVEGGSAFPINDFCTTRKWDGVGFISVMLPEFLSVYSAHGMYDYAYYLYRALPAQLSH